MRRTMLLGLLALGLALHYLGAVAEQCQWGGVDVQGRVIPPDSWLCSDRVIHGTPPTPLPGTATPLPSPTLLSPTPSPTVSLAAVRTACRDALSLVQEYPNARGVPLRHAVASALAATRTSSARFEVDGWSASGPPPPCQVQYTYRENGLIVRLRWEVDPSTGDVIPLDPRTAQVSGL